MINRRTANSKDTKELYRIQEQKVMFKIGFKKCPNCQHRTVYRLHQDKSLYCYTCSWKDITEEPTVEQPKVKVTDLQPRLVKKPKLV